MRLCMMGIDHVPLFHVLPVLVDSLGHQLPHPLNFETSFGDDAELFAVLIFGFLYFY